MAGDSPKINIRTWWNNHTGQKILQSYSSEQVQSKYKEFSLFWKCFENIIGGQFWFFFQEILNKYILRLQKINNHRYQMRAQSRFFSKKRINEHFDSQEYLFDVIRPPHYLLWHGFNRCVLYFFYQVMPITYFDMA